MGFFLFIRHLYTPYLSNLAPPSFMQRFRYQMSRKTVRGGMIPLPNHSCFVYQGPKGPTKAPKSHEEVNSVSSRTRPGYPGNRSNRTSFSHRFLRVDRTRRIPEKTRGQSATLMGEMERCDWMIEVVGMEKCPFGQFELT